MPHITWPPDPMVVTITTQRAERHQFQIQAQAVVIQLEQTIREIPLTPELRQLVPDPLALINAIEKNRAESVVVRANAPGSYIKQNITEHHLRLQMRRGQLHVSPDADTPLRPLESLDTQTAALMGREGALAAAAGLVTAYWLTVNPTYLNSISRINGKFSAPQDRVRHLLNPLRIPEGYTWQQWTSTDRRSFTRLRRVAPGIHASSWKWAKFLEKKQTADQYPLLLQAGLDPQAAFNLSLTAHWTVPENFKLSGPALHWATQYARHAKVSSTKPAILTIFEDLAEIRSLLKQRRQAGETIRGIPYALNGPWRRLSYTSGYVLHKLVTASLPRFAPRHLSGALAEARKLAMRRRWIGNNTYDLRERLQTRANVIHQMTCDPDVTAAGLAVHQVDVERAETALKHSSLTIASITPTRRSSPTQEDLDHSFKVLIQHTQDALISVTRTDGRPVHEDLINELQTAFYGARPSHLKSPTRFVIRPRI